MLILLMIRDYGCPYGDCPGWGGLWNNVPVSVLLLFFPSPSAAAQCQAHCQLHQDVSFLLKVLGEPTETHQQEICPCILFFNIHWVGVRKSKLCLWVKFYEKFHVFPSNSVALNMFSDFSYSSLYWSSVGSTSRLRFVIAFSISSRAAFLYSTKC